MSAWRAANSCTNGVSTSGRSWPSSARISSQRDGTTVANFSRISEFRWRSITVWLSSRKSGGRMRPPIISCGC
jgi:hypothetical protein